MLVPWPKKLSISLQPLAPTIPILSKACVPHFSCQKHKRKGGDETLKNHLTPKLSEVLLKTPGHLMQNKKILIWTYFYNNMYLYNSNIYALLKYLGYLGTSIWNKFNISYLIRMLLVIFYYRLVNYLACSRFPICIVFWCL